MNKIYPLRVTIFCLLVVCVIPLWCQAQTVSGRGHIVHGSETLFQELHSGQFIENNRLRSKNIKVLDTAQAYENVLTDYSREAAKPVDFSKGKVLLIDMGQQLTGGYGVRVSAIEEHLSHVVVKIILTTPSSACMLIQALTHPYQFVYIASRKKIVVEEGVSVKDCG